jgi:uncharacterized protein YdeI (YjbR/CyaY-like superfamily)
MGTKDSRIDAYIAKAQPFARPILICLRKAVHEGCPEVEESLKWSHPAFMYKGILCGMAAFKEHVTFGFWKASAMNGIGEKSGDAAGQFGRITSVDDLPGNKAMVGLVKQAAALHDEGVKAPRMKGAPKKPITEPDYFTVALKKNKKALKTYEAFSPSAKREYLEWITEAKGDATRQRRLETAIGWMAEGKQRNWKYM